MSKFKYSLVAYYYGDYLKKLLIILGLLSILGDVFAAPWDILRIPINYAVIINPVVMWVVLIVSVLLLVISGLAFKKRQSKKLLFVFSAFGLFFIKSALGLIDLYVSPGVFMNFAVQGLFDLLIIGLFAIALFKK